MAGRRCRTCNQGAAAKARDGLCAGCWKASQPQTIDGVTIKRLRENLSVSINGAAAIISVDPKHFVDAIEGNMELDIDYARAITIALEVLADERQTSTRRTQDAHTAREPAPAPAASLAAGGIR